jgi:hypothetical protein
MPSVFPHWERNLGAQIMPCVAATQWNLAEHIATNYSEHWQPNSTNVEYLDRFLALAGAQNTTVYWLITPTHPAVADQRERGGFEARYLDFVRWKQARFPTMVVIDAFRARYATDVFFDPDHLGREGAFALSEDIGEILRRHRATNADDRWVELPHYRARTARGALEDVFAPAQAAAMKLSPSVR